MTQTKQVNPWTWQDSFGFSQAIDVRQGGRVLYCAGQTSVDASGAPLHAGNMAAQLTQAFDNLETVLKAAGLTLRHVVRLNYYTCDVPAFLQAAGAFGPRLRAAGVQPAGTLLGVASLFHSDILVEIEATAVE